MTTGIVGLGTLVLVLVLDVHAQGGGDLGLPLGPGGVERLRRLAGAELDRFPGPNED
jgi:hypothetical protein